MVLSILILLALGSPGLCFNSRQTKWSAMSRGKIVGGVEVARNEIPYQVNLNYPPLGITFCGGVVLNQDYVITAAHCCDNLSGIKVIAGERDLSQEEGTEQVKEIATVIQHEDFNYATAENDICLLKLDSSLIFSDAVKAAVLPERGQNFEGTAIVSGWGSLSEQGASPDVLMKVAVPVVTDEECRQSYGDELFDDVMICAGEKGKDACAGDSGGPMTCDNGILCGLVSWGNGCGREGYPGVYTEISAFIDWIERNAQ